MVGLEGDHRNRRGPRLGPETRWLVRHSLMPPLEDRSKGDDFPPPNSAHCHASLQKSQLERISPDHLQLD
ncbi:hypothetical protein EYF80_037789 [Liparis tanakae]|uniref:Uncharacterized protein n=1 Tax=Liparis tanakae TaxID=230148 RepID=A0A4Z2GGG8_9TELE|nr:hypothetical protein EYF80_037789 [Liparis tanakae]